MPSSSLAETIMFELGAQEPWPNDVKLYQPYVVEQILLPDNANCLAVQAFLHMCGLPFQVEQRANAEFMSPTGRVPFIKCGSFVIPDLEQIIQFVAQKGISLTHELDNEQKADMRAYMSIIYTVLMNAELYICWCDDKVYNEVTKPRNGSVYPWPLNHFQTWAKKAAVIRKLKVLKWHQKTLDNVYQEVETCCQALSERLEGKDYFFGPKPVELDALLYGNLFSILSEPSVNSTLVSIILKFPNLIRLCKRICDNYMQHNSLCYDKALIFEKTVSNTIHSPDTIDIVKSSFSEFMSMIDSDSVLNLIEKSNLELVNLSIKSDSISLNDVEADYNNLLENFNGDKEDKSEKRKPANDKNNSCSFEKELSSCESLPSYGKPSKSLYSEEVDNSDTESFKLYSSDDE